MKIEDFKELTKEEPVILHTDNGRKGKKLRRLTMAATVVNGKLLIARTVCGDFDQFNKKTGVSHALGRLTSALTHLKNNTLEKVSNRWNGLVEVIEYKSDYDHKEVLQCLKYIDYSK